MPRWRSLRLRLTLLALWPLVFAFVMAMAVVWGLGNQRVEALLTTQLRTNLAATNRHFDQLRERVQQQVQGLAASDRLRQLRAGPGDGAEMAQLLAHFAQANRLDFLVLADGRGVVQAASANVPAGALLPAVHVVTQARSGVGAVAYERLTLQQAGMLGAERTGLSAPVAPASAPTPDVLTVMAGVHLPLQTDLPNHMLVGGVVLRQASGALDRARDVVFPVGALPDGSEGVVALYLQQGLVGASQNHTSEGWRPSATWPAAAEHTVLTQGQAWLGPLVSEGRRYMAGFAPLKDGRDQVLGALAVAFSERPYERLGWGMVTAVGGVLALALLAVSAVFWWSGQRLVTRVQQISQVAHAVRVGHNDARVGWAAEGDELADLANDVDRLLDTLARHDAEQRRTQDALRQTRDQLSREHGELSRVLAGTRAGTWAWNVQTGETRFNDRWAEIVGYTLDELAPVSIDTWARLCHPQDMAVSEAALQRHFSGEQAFYDCEVRMRHRDGHWVWVHDRGSVQSRTPDGRPEWMHGTHMDITVRREAQAAQQELLDRLQRLSANVPGVIYQYQQRADGRARFLYASAGLVEIYGCQPQDVWDDASPVFEVIHADDLVPVSEGIRASAKRLSPWHAVYRVNHPRKGLLWVEGNATPERQSDGSVVWHGYIRDVTTQQRDQQRLRLAASVFDAAHDGIMITNADQVIIDVNASFCRITGLRRDEAIGQRPDILRSGRHDAAFYAAMHQSLQQTDRWQGEIWNRRKSGELYAELLSIAAVRDPRGRIGHYVAMFSDITGIKAHQSELDRIAHYDALTGIPNRRLLRDRMAQAMAHSQRHQTPLAVCMLDLDGFKPVNDKHGHEAGDQLLIEVARRLQHNIRAEETVARLGGDEFVLLLFGDGVPVVCERVLQALRQPVVLASGTVQVSASMGVAHHRSGVTDGDQLLREADQALYASKAAGRDRVTVFDAPVAL